MVKTQYKTIKKYRVVIPYYYEFFVSAHSRQEAIDLAHGIDGKMICYGREEAEVEVIK